MQISQTNPMQASTNPENHQEQQAQEPQNNEPASLHISQPPQNNQPPSAEAENFASQEDEQIDEEEGEIDEQPMQAQEEPSPEQDLSQVNQPINKDAYINKLQTYVNKIKQDLAQKCKDHDDLNQDNKKTKETLKKVRFDFLSSKQQISALSQQKSELQKQTESLRHLNEELTKEIVSFKEAGDVNLFKSRISELQKLLELQKQQIEVKKTMIDERDEIEGDNKQLKDKVNILGMIEKYEIQNKKLEGQLNLMQVKNQQLQQQLEQSVAKNQELSFKNNQNDQSQQALSLKVQKLEERLKSQQEEFTRKLKQCQESTQQLQKTHLLNQQPQPLPQLPRKPSLKNPQQKYGIWMLTPTQERDLIMREFIELQVKHVQLTEELTALRERHYHTLREVKNLSATHVSKKDYSQLYKKYTKLRHCLENSLLTEEALRNQLNQFTEAARLNQFTDEARLNQFTDEARLNQFTDPARLNQFTDPASIQNTQDHQPASLGYQNVSSSQQQLNSTLESRYRSMILEEPQNAVNHVQKIIQKSYETQQHFLTLKQQLETKQRLIKTQKLLKDQQDQIVNLQQQLQAKQNLTNLYDQELAFKNNEIQLLRTAHQQNLNKIHHLQTSTIQKTQQRHLLSQIQSQKTDLQILQVKSLQGIRENNTLKHQNHLLTELYNNLKTMYEELIRKQPQTERNSSQAMANEQTQPNSVIMQPRACKECQQRQEKQKQTQLASCQSQTEGLAELYFKQIKSLLTIMKKFPQKVDDITTKLDSEKGTIHEAKKKLDQATETYGAKYRQLQQEKKANDQWRVKQREQIREEFQEIRELLINERLMSALKKAKSLIEYYQENAQEVQEEAAEEVEEEANDKNEPEDAIEQEKQNP